MPFSIGLDIGGTKIAGVVFDESGNEHTEKTVPTPEHYKDFLAACGKLVKDFDKATGQKPSVGIGVPGIIDPEKGTIFAANIAGLKDRPFMKDIEDLIERPIRIANDADCAALAEALDGAGQGYHSVFGLTMGTGVGGGFVINGKLRKGAHGLAGEFGHLPLPFREDSDGPTVLCNCGQKGCIDKSISGSGLARLYASIAQKEATAAQIAELARQNDAEAAHVLDFFYTTVAKAMTTIIHTFDPDIIVAGGGASNLPGLYEEVPKRWGRYAVIKKLKTKFVPSKFGSLSGARGAASLVRMKV